MLDFATRRFTIRLGRTNKSTPANGERAKRRTSVVGRKPSARRVSVRSSAALRRAPSGAGVHRGTSVRRSPSTVRRGASVKRSPSAARRNSKRISAYVDGIPPSTSVPSSSVQPSPPTDQSNPVPSDAPAVPLVTSPTSKSFFSKLTSRFRGRSTATKAQLQFQSQSQPPVLPSLSSGLVATLSATNLSPLVVAPPRSPSLRSPSPGSRVTFVDTVVEAEKVANAGMHLGIPSSQEAADSSLTPEVTQMSSSPVDTVLPSLPLVDIADEDAGVDDEWVDAEDDEADAEPHAIAESPVDIINPAQTNSGVGQHDAPECASGEASRASLIPPEADASSPQQGVPVTGDLSESVQLQVEALNDLDRESTGVDVRVSQWLAVTPVVVVGEEQTSTGDSRVRSLEGIIEGMESLGGGTAPPKSESKRPRPPHIIVPDSGSKLSSNNPFRVPLPPSPSPSNLAALAETNPFRSPTCTQPSLTVESSVNEQLPPLSPSILLTPAAQFDDYSSLDVPRTSDECLSVDVTQVPLPPSPSLSCTSPGSQRDDDRSSISPSTTANLTRAGSVSTSGRRSLSTTPSSRGPPTPTSIRVPGHPSLAHFSFGGPNSPIFKVEDCEDGEEERRGRSLEVKEGKRRMRSVSPQLDAVLEGDESRRSSRASFEGTELPSSADAKPTLSLLTAVEEDVKFGRRNSDDTDSEHEDEAGFFAFAERQLEEQKKAAEAQQLAVPKRSKTMSFLAAGFGKRRSTAGDLSESASPNSVSRSATSSQLLGLPAAGPKRSSTLLAPSSSVGGANRLSRLVPGQRSSTMLAEPLSPRVALSPTMYSAGDIQAAAGKIEDEESRRLSEAVFMF